MKPITILTIVLSVLCLFIMNIVFADDVEEGSEEFMSRDFFVNGAPGEKDYDIDTIDDTYFEQEVKPSKNALPEDRKPTARAIAPKKNSNMDIEIKRNPLKVDRYEVDTEDSIF